MNNNYPNSNASKGKINQLIDLAKKEELNNNYFEAIRLYSLVIKKTMKEMIIVIHLLGF